MPSQQKRSSQTLHQQKHTAPFQPDCWTTRGRGQSPALLRPRSCWTPVIQNPQVTTHRETHAFMCHNGGNVNGHIPPLGFSSISYNDLIKITDGFNDRPVSEGGCRLGEGGFGTVYKGILNHKLVAVKKLIPVSDGVFSLPLWSFVTANGMSFRWRTCPWRSYKSSSTRRSKL